MAKVTFLQGKARGKVGGIVYRTEAGLGTIASEYNPSPRNPRTLAQTKQRGKMNLAGRISKETPYAAFAGLGSTRRNARSLFVSNLLKSIEVNDGGTTASVAYGNVKLSTGMSVAVQSVQNITTNTTTGVVTDEVSLEFMDTTLTKLGALIVCYVQNSDGSINCIAKKMGANDALITLTLGNANADTYPTKTALYVIPIIDNGVDARVAYNNLSMSSTAFEAAMIRTLVSAGAYCESVFVSEENIAHS